MSKIVTKFGGSNLRNDKDIRQILQVVRNYKRPIVVVVSAFYGVTNLLEELLLRARHDDESIHQSIEDLIELKRKAIFGIIGDPERQKTTLDQVVARIRELERYLLGVRCIGDIPSFVNDIVLSYGERLSALVLTAMLQDQGVNCAMVTPEAMGLITDGEFGNATVDFAASTEAVRKRLSVDQTIVVPGFYGISKDGRVNLFGRGGSDYTAASLACCLNAESLDIWKDVDGFHSADPKLVPDTVNIDRLNYTEAAELAYFGAKILHPRTVEPLMPHNIPIRIFNIANTDSPTQPFTIIAADGTQKSEVIKSVTYSDDFCILKLQGPGVGNKPGILAKVTAELDRNGINIKSVITAQTSINFLLGIKDLQAADRAVRSLPLPAVNNLVTEEDLSLIAVVGQGILEKHGIAARIFGAVSRKGINVEIISVGASPVAAYFIVRKADRDEAVRTIHHEFFA